MRLKEAEKQTSDEFSLTLDRAYWHCVLCKSFTPLQPREKQFLLFYYNIILCAVGCRISSPLRICICHFRTVNRFSALASCLTPLPKLTPRWTVVVLTLHYCLKHLPVFRCSEKLTKNKAEQLLHSLLKIIYLCMDLKDITFCNYPEYLFKTWGFLICLYMLIIHGVRIIDLLTREHGLPNFCFLCNLSISKLLPVYKN